MVVGGSQQETLDLGFVLLGIRQQGVPVILRELMIPDGFDPVSLSFTVRGVTTKLSVPRLTSFRLIFICSQCELFPTYTSKNRSYY
ncbi:unnamed protein product [Schistosoma mattheei]|uniref:Uncharacterized protein n=1 Tax=Schistosoma mattheei TaxID=31246 RepID=A0A183P8H3_9TREM|nr:unnamed protein product [Schistosoma mattheei]